MSSVGRPLLLFLSYAHADHRLFEQFCDALVPLERREVVRRWDDREIPPGGEWDRTIKAKLFEADVVVFLVSTNFLASRYCWEEEVTRALEREVEGASILPVYLHDIDPVLTPFGEFDGVPKEKGRLKPVQKFGHRPSAWKMVQKALLRLAREIQPAGNGAGRSTAPRRVWHVPAERATPLVGRESVLERMPTQFAAGGARRMIALVGEGGVGKTSLAVEYCWRRRSDYDVVVWLRSETPALLATQYAAMALVVGLPVSDQESSKAAFFEWLQTHDRWLMVFDNAAGPEELSGFLPETLRGDVIVTSQNRSWDGVAHQIPVEPLTQEQAMRYLLDATGIDDVFSAAELIRFSRGNPRELELAVRRVRRGDTLAAYVAELQARTAGSA